MARLRELLLLGLCLVSPAFAGPSLEAAADLRTRKDPITGFVVQIQGPSAAYAGSPEAAARKFISEHKAMLGIVSNLEDLKAGEVRKSPGDHHVAFTQTFRSSQIIRARIDITLNEKGQIFLLHSSYVQRDCLEAAPKKPKLSEAAILAIARAKYRNYTYRNFSGKAVKPDGEGKAGPFKLVYLRTGKEKYDCRLVYELHLGPVLYRIDSQDGTVFHEDVEFVS